MMQGSDRRFFSARTTNRHVCREIYALVMARRPVRALLADVVSRPLDEASGSLAPNPANAFSIIAPCKGATCV